MFSIDISELLKPEVFFLLFIAVILTYIFIHLSLLKKEVTNHIPTQITEVKTKINKLEDNINELRTDVSEIKGMLKILIDKK